MQVEVGRGVWVLIAVVIVLIGAQQFLGWPGEGRLASGFSNAMHGPWFFVLTLVMIELGARALGWRRRWRTVFDVLGLAFVVAVGTEAVQILTARDAGWLDIGLDMLGAVAALAFWAARAGLCRRWTGVAVAVMALTLSSLPLLGALGVAAHQRNIAPTLVDFESPWWRVFTRTNSAMALVEPPAAWRGTAAPVLKVTLADTVWPGLRLHEPLSDWSAYEKLQLQVYVPGTSPLRLSVSIRLRNAPLDHVYRNFDLAPGPHLVNLSFTELFDAGQARIKELVIYSTRDHAGQVVMVGGLSLL
jgi:hypothetical protein